MNKNSHNARSNCHISQSGRYLTNKTISDLQEKVLQHLLLASHVRHSRRERQIGSRMFEMRSKVFTPLSPQEPRTKSSALSATTIYVQKMFGWEKISDTESPQSSRKAGKTLSQ